MPSKGHTPVPWRLGSGAVVVGDYIEPDGSNKGATAVVADCRTRFLSQRECDGNANFIIRAVNNHAAMLEALRGMLRMYQVGPEADAARAAIRAATKGE